MNKISLLIVEDEPIIAADLTICFNRMGYQVLDSLHSGEEALEYLKSQQPDLILMDVQLDGQLDGIETVQRINQQYHLPTIYLTSNTDNATFTRAKNTNPAAFLSKPFRQRDLQTTIELALANFNRKETEGEIDNPELIETAFLLRDRIFVKHKERLVRLFLKDILIVEASGCYCTIVTHNQEFLLTMNLKNLMQRIEQDSDLMRVHRSFAINLMEIEEIGELFVFIKNRKVPISKTYRAELLKVLKTL